MKKQNEDSEQRFPVSTQPEKDELERIKGAAFRRGALVRMSASAVGIAAVGGAVGGFFGPFGSGLGVIAGGVIGCAAAASDNLKSNCAR